MLEHTKKPHTDVAELRFRGPVARQEEAAQALKNLGFVPLPTESTPWRESFPEHTDKEIPAVCLRAARRREGLTQKELADMSGIPQAHISSMERGLMPIGVIRAKRLGKALNVGYKVFL